MSVTYTKLEDGTYNIKSICTNAYVGVVIDGTTLKVKAVTSPADWKVQQRTTDGRYTIGQTTPKLSTFYESGIVRPDSAKDFGWALEPVKYNESTVYSIVTETGKWKLDNENKTGLIFVTQPGSAAGDTSCLFEFQKV